MGEMGACFFNMRVGVIGHMTVDVMRVCKRVVGHLLDVDEQKGSSGHQIKRWKTRSLRCVRFSFHCFTAGDLELFWGGFCVLFVFVWLGLFVWFVLLSTISGST